MVHWNRGLCELCAKPNERYVRSTQGLYEVYMKSNTSNGNRYQPPHSAGGPAIGGSQKRVKTKGSEKGVARKPLKHLVLRRF